GYRGDAGRTTTGEAGEQQDQTDRAAGAGRASQSPVGGSRIAAHQQTGHGDQGDRDERGRQDHGWRRCLAGRFATDEVPHPVEKGGQAPEEDTHYELTPPAPLSVRALRIRAASVSSSSRPAGRALEKSMSWTSSIGRRWMWR